MLIIKELLFIEFLLNLINDGEDCFVKLGCKWGLVCIVWVLESFKCCVMWLVEFFDDGVFGDVYFYVGFEFIFFLMFYVGGGVVYDYF